MKDVFARLLVVVALLFGVPTTVSGCSAYQAYVQRKAIENAKFSLKGVQILSFDLVGVNLLITLALDNPTDTAIVLDRLDYKISVNNMPAASGYMQDTLTVPAGGSRPLPLRLSIAYADVSNQVRTLFMTRKITVYGLEGMAHFDTPVGTIDYPIKLEQHP